MMDSPQAIKLYFYDKWVAEDGLARLDLNDSRPGNPGFPETVKNENGILFLFVAILLFRQQLVFAWGDGAKFLEAARRLERPDAPGIFCRHPGELDVHEAHDNYMAIAAGSALFDPNRDLAKRIFERGTETGFNFNNVEPNKMRLEDQRQGGDVAFYSICAGRVPTPWDLLWLLVGLMIGAFQKNASTRQLGYCRFSTLVEQKVVAHLPTYQVLLILLAALAYSIVLDFRKPFWADYYDASHPIRRLAELK